MDTITKPKWSEKFNLGDAPIGVEQYISQAHYEKEVETIFRKTWLMVARAEEIAKPGDWKLKKLEFASASVILMHGKDGVIRAFHNVCSHRGNTVITEKGHETYGHNRAGVLTCRFHGWVYGSDGELVQVPEQEKFLNTFCKAENSLTPIHCEVWNGFVFINLAQEPDRTLREYLAGFAAHLDGYPFEKMGHCFAYSGYVDCNWKIAVDAFSEAYHVHTIHAGSFPNVFDSDLYEVKLFNEHRTCALLMQAAAPPPPPMGQLAIDNAVGTLTASREGTNLPDTINPNKLNGFSFELSVAFPNTLIHVTEGIWFTHVFWPVAVDKIYWEGKYYVEKPQTNSQRWALQHDIIVQRDAWLEDTATMENTHRALLSGAKSHLHLQDDEVFLRHQDKVVREYVNS